MGSVLKTGLRGLVKRKGETISVILLLALSVSFFAGLHIDSVNFQNYLTSGFIDTMGHISLFGDFSYAVEKELNNFSDIDGFEFHYYVLGYTVTDKGEKRPVILIDSSLTNKPVVSSKKVFPKGNEAYIYESLEYGSENSVYPESLQVFTYNYSSRSQVPLSLEIKGMIKGIASFSGSHVLVLVVNEDLLGSLTGGNYTWISVWVKNPTDARIENVSSELKDDLSRLGYSVEYVWVNKVERNPIALMISGMASFFTPFILAGIILVSVLSAASGLAVVERETRMIAVLKSLGTGSRKIIGFYSITWIIRILIGITVGILFSGEAGKIILYLGMRGDTSITNKLIELYGFNIPFDILLKDFMISLGITLLGLSIPAVFAYRVKTVEGLRFYGLKELGIVSSKLRRLNVTLRTILVRPWKTISLILLIGIIWGVSSGAVLAGHSINNSIDEYYREMLYDTVIYISPIHYNANYSANELFVTITETGLIEKIQIVSSTNMWDIIPNLTAATMVSTILIGDDISYRALEGRLPVKKGEILIGQTLSILLKKNINDTLTLRLRNGTLLKMRIVGIGVNKNNGFYVALSKEDYKAIIGNVLPQTIYVKVKPGVKPRAAGNTIKQILENKLPVLVDFGTKDELYRSNMRNSQEFSLITGGFLFTTIITGITTLTALFVIDYAGRLREISVLKAIGVTNIGVIFTSIKEVLIGFTLSMPLSFIIAVITQRISLEKAIYALGYIRPTIDIRGFITTGLATIIMSILVVFAVLLLYLKRQDLSSNLRIE